MNTVHQDFVEISVRLCAEISYAMAEYSNKASYSFFKPQPEMEIAKKLQAAAFVLLRLLTVNGKSELTQETIHAYAGLLTVFNAGLDQPNLKNRLDPIVNLVSQSMGLYFAKDGQEALQLAADIKDNLPQHIDEIKKSKSQALR